VGILFLDPLIIVEILASLLLAYLAIKVLSFCTKIVKSISFSGKN
jgi:hypothetical protein